MVLVCCCNKLNPANVYVRFQMKRDPFKGYHTYRVLVSKKPIQPHKVRSIRGLTSRNTLIGILLWKLRCSAQKSFTSDSESSLIQQSQDFIYPEATINRKLQQFQDMPSTLDSPIICKEQPYKTFQKSSG